MRTVFLNSPRLELREISLELTVSLQELDSDPEVVRFINNGAPAGSLDDYRGWIERVSHLYGRGFGYWAAYEQERFAGWFHYVPSQVEPEADELGYRLNRESWGRGLATEGSQALLDWAMRQGRRNITARALLANGASVRVLQKVGFELEREYEETRFPGEDKRAGFFRWKSDPNGIL